MSRRRQLLVLAFLLLLAGALAWALIQRPYCVGSETMLATSCFNGYEPRKGA